MRNWMDQKYIFPLRSESVDSQNFAYLDKGSKNVVDPTDPDPKNCF